MWNGILFSISPDPIVHDPIIDLSMMSITHCMESFKDILYLLRKRSERWDVWVGGLVDHVELEENGSGCRGEDHHHGDQEGDVVLVTVMMIRVGGDYDDGDVTISWLPNQMISLILIFGFLCRSSIFIYISIPRWLEKYSTAMCYVTMILVIVNI